jgi:hypothetical protein
MKSSINSILVSPMYRPTSPRTAHLSSRSNFRCPSSKLGLNTRAELYIRARGKESGRVEHSRRICLESTSASCEVRSMIWQLPRSNTSTKDRILSRWLINHV